MIAKAPKESQAEKFKHLARELGADDDEAVFEAKLKRLAKAKPVAKPAKQRAKKAR